MSTDTKVSLGATLGATYLKFGQDHKNMSVHEKEELFKNIFMKVSKDTINQNDLDSLFRWLEEHKFYTSPASTRFHGSYESGLLDHTLNVITASYDLIQVSIEQDGVFANNTDSYTAIQLRNSLIKVAALHDVCKAGAYIKNNGERTDRPVNEYPYFWNKEHPSGHGELSVKIASKLIPLTEEEKLAINWHMGLYDHRLAIYSSTGPNDETNDEQLKRYRKMRDAFEDARKKSPLVDAIHIADMMASRLFNE